MSAQQLARRTLIDQVDAALKDSGADPRQLQIELTEHALIEDVAANVQMLAILKLRGMKIAIDDFGTGLSSLSYLKRLPIDKIKVDRSFVNELSSASADAHHLARAVVRFAVSLGKTTTAEGVETKEQLDILREEGCAETQGYYFGRPMPASGIAKILRRGARAAVRAA